MHWERKIFFFPLVCVCVCAGGGGGSFLNGGNILTSRSAVTRLKIPCSKPWKCACRPLWDHQSPQRAAGRPGTCLRPRQASPHSKALVYYYPRKQIITTGHFLDEAQSRLQCAHEGWTGIVYRESRALQTATPFHGAISETGVLLSPRNAPMLSHVKIRATYSLSEGPRSRRSAWACVICAHCCYFFSFPKLCKKFVEDN